MTFLTNSAFVYLEYFDVGEKPFALYFGANVVVMMAFTLVTSRRIQRIPPFRLFRAGRRLQLVFVFAVAAAVLLANIVASTIPEPRGFVS